MRIGVCPDKGKKTRDKSRRIKSGFIAKQVCYKGQIGLINEVSSFVWYFKKIPNFWHIIQIFHKFDMLRFLSFEHNVFDKVHRKSATYGFIDIHDGYRHPGRICRKAGYQEKHPFFITSGDAGDGG